MNMKGSMGGMFYSIILSLPLPRVKDRSVLGLIRVF